MGSARDLQSAGDVALAAIQALGRGFDVTTDFRLKYSKLPVIQLNDEHLQKILLPGDVCIPNASRNITCDKGERMRFSSDVMAFQQMSEFFNKNASIEGKIPLGFFNAMFEFSGSWQADASQTKSLALDGFFIALYNLRLTGAPLSAQEDIKNAVPSTWEPAGLARFIEKYGTHIIMSVSVGGQDVLFLKENHSSLMSAPETKKYLKRIGDQEFGDESSQRGPLLKGKENKVHKLCTPGNQAPYAQISELHSTQLRFDNKDMKIISRKRGGNVLSRSHDEWQETVHSTPDVISMSFIPITSLLSGVSGCGFLNHAINLYLRYKPPVEELQYFLEFQGPRQWAPVYNELPLGPPRKQLASPSLQFSFMGPKLFVNSTQVAVDRKPITGIRLYLEGRKTNRLAIHLQHLSSLPRVLQGYWKEKENLPLEQPKWRGFDDGYSKWFEPVQWRSFSHVCTAPIKYNPEWVSNSSDAFIVTGAQLQVKDHGLKNVLFLSLQFTRIPGCIIHRSCWDHPLTASQKSGFFSTLSFTSQAWKKEKKNKPIVVNSGIFPDGPPLPLRLPKLLKFVNTAESTKGPQDMPGHWLVTGAQLELDRGKICLRAKYSVLAY